LALDTVDHAEADMLGFEQVVGEGLEDVAEQEVRAGQSHSLSAQRLYQLIDRAGRVHLDILLEVLAENAHRLAVEKELDVGVAPGAGYVDLVGSLQEQRPGVVELD